ncbi:vacuolar protein sorting/targeting protein PEP1 [Plectosphaerella plurivora]|uniref:Vacuolar protein sorting/targeting protein 10 n=1 Tax=Plectosphaerella plurivora TaxID=936078 RepID=A0A9P8VDS8_9PEZI|nr:vacuolar protein sorting/targeting protein PEP1 [Plectosphaerella plurivora]
MRLASWRILLPAAALWWASALAKDESPTIKATEVKHLPLSLSYFEDSDVILYQDVPDGNVLRSEDAGATWERTKDIPEGKSRLLIMHEFDNSRAFVITEDQEHYKTTDKGKTWQKFDAGARPDTESMEILRFHASEPDHIIFTGLACLGPFCAPMDTYTTDNFKSGGKELRKDTSGCWWAKSSVEFTTGQADLDKNRILCIVLDYDSSFRQSQRLFVSDNFYQSNEGKIQEFEPNLDTTHAVQGVVNIAVVKKYLLVATATPGSDEMSLFVTDDTIKWHRAMFPTAHGHKINQGAYTILESTNYSIQVDVRTSRPSNPLGVLFTSNSNGTYFVENLEHTNRNIKGNVDFEKIANIKGIFLVNTVENYEEVEKSGNAAKTIVTQITFDDGRTFQEVKAGGERLHLHSISDIDNMGRIFSSPAPGLVMGVGNTGKSLKPFGTGDLYVSDNAGASWKKALDGPHKYEFGDQGSILVAVKDSTEDNISEIQFSLDHGENWKKAALPNDMRIRPLILTTTQDSTSLKFLIVASSSEDTKFHIIAIDFEGLHERTCKDDDLEDWHARVDDDKKATCLMGHKQTFRRRKKDADCFMKQEFKDPEPKLEVCECTDLDFECDYNFVRKDGKCEKEGPIVQPDGACTKADDTFKGSSGWRKIPGNMCERTKGEQKDDPVDRTCSDTVNAPAPPATGDISHTQHVFEKSDLGDFEKVYLERGTTESDETILARAVDYDGSGSMRVDKHIYRTTDHGKKWEPILKDKDIRGIYPHQYFKNTAFFTTDSQKVIYTVDGALTFHSFEAPSKAGGENPFSFHPDKKDWLLWVGEKCEDVEGSCHKEASISLDRGDNWRTAQRYVRKCEFTGSTSYRFRDIKQIICLAHSNEDKTSPMVIISSNDFFETDSSRHESNVKDFATMAEFIVVAAEDKEKKGLRALASMDGETYAEAMFPFNFKVDHQNAYTVLDSSTHAVNLFVATETAKDQRYGSIIKSNSNGTSYVMSAPKVNCNNNYFVDFEKIIGLEGVVLINSVAGTTKDGQKMLQTLISHSDGAQWAYLPPPRSDVEGKNYKCGGGAGTSDCALHLHHYTERVDKKKTFSAASAVGFMFGYGNVGSSLTSVDDADTFMTTDAGISWKSVKKGAWLWQYGDQGSIAVLVRRSTGDKVAKTNIISYTIDSGETWKDYKFSEKEVAVTDITTQRSGMSRNFLLWCRDGGESFSVNIDFSGLTDRPCDAIQDGESKDYHLWSPKHPLQENNCLFGHQSFYQRKNPDAKCYNDYRIPRQYEMRNCTCTRSDFECDYNFEMDSNSQCSLVTGKEPISADQWCKENPEESTFWEPTGYRRIPLTTCVGGTELDKTSSSHACKGKEEEYEREHRTSGVAIFFAVIIPFAVAGGIGWWVWRNWNGKFGQIRLGESNSFDSDQPWVKYPVIAVSAIVAVTAALPLVVSALWRTATSAYERVSGGGGRGGGSWLNGGANRRFTTRDSFARGRGDYATVDEDEGELLGDDSDEDV